ncbi:hypothetical protein NPIL_231091 [Nephila pilipes]|uniref:Uncharacterized protein n=1 Tax=Nephila pilipes TaxID=299642 RepID=A0A8X6UVM4_NEPPI|nr:hypothetical protein NPIL_231091 [Nephila pilipes]
MQRVVVVVGHSHTKCLSFHETRVWSQERMYVPPEDATPENSPEIIPLSFPETIPEKIPAPLEELPKLPAPVETLPEPSLPETIPAPL